MKRQSEPQSMATTATGSSPTASRMAIAPARPGAGTVFVRALRLLLRRALYIFARVLGPLRPYAGFLALIVVLLGVIGWLGYQAWFPASAAPNDMRVAFIAPSMAVENYIKGQQNYNAELMWTSLSTELQASQLQNGASKQAMQSSIDGKKTRGLRFGKYAYIGGTKLDDGGNMYFYSVDVQMQGQKARLPMTFFADSDGKVVYISSSSLLSDLSTSAPTQAQ